jgi:hypothetical protein
MQFSPQSSRPAFSGLHLVSSFPPLVGPTGCHRNFINDAMITCKRQKIDERERTNLELHERSPCVWTRAYSRTRAGTFRLDLRESGSGGRINDHVAHHIMTIFLASSHRHNHLPINVMPIGLIVLPVLLLCHVRVIFYPFGDMWVAPQLSATPLFGHTISLRGGQRNVKNL